MPIFRRRKSDNNLRSSSQEEGCPSNQMTCNGNTKAIRPTSLQPLLRRSHTVPSSSDIDLKALEGVGTFTQDHVSSQPSLASKTGGKTASPTMSSNRKSSNKDSPTCSKSRNEKFHKLFKSVPEEETPIDYFSCAFLGDILLHGNMYVSPNWICFYSKIRAKGRQVEIPMEKVLNITREKTAIIIPNAIGVKTAEEKYVFGSFMTRDSTYKFMVSVWKKSQDSTDSPKDQSISSPELPNPMITLTTSQSPVEVTASVENNNIIPTVIDTPKLPGLKLPVQNGDVTVESSDSELSFCPDCGLVNASDSDRKPLIKKTTIDKQSKQNASSGPHRPVIMQCFQFEKTYDAVCRVALKLQRIPRTNFLLAICTFMVLFLLMSAVALTYKLLLLQAKLESRHVWSDVLKFENREKMYNDIYSLHSQVHTATIQQIHTVLQANIELLSEMSTSLKNLHKSYSAAVNSDTGDCS